MVEACWTSAPHPSTMTLPEGVHEWGARACGISFGKASLALSNESPHAPAAPSSRLPPGSPKPRGDMIKIRHLLVAPPFTTYAAAPASEQWVKSSPAKCLLLPPQWWPGWCLRMVALALARSWRGMAELPHLLWWSLASWWGWGVAGRSSWASQSAL